MVSRPRGGVFIFLRLFKYVLVSLYPAIPAPIGLLAGNDDMHSGRLSMVLNGMPRTPSDRIFYRRSQPLCCWTKTIRAVSDS